MDAQYRRLMTLARAQGGLPLEVIVQALDGLTRKEVKKLRKIALLEDKTHSHWTTGNGEKIRIRDMSDLHLYNAIQRFFTIGIIDIQKVLIYEFKKRGYDPLIKTEKFEELNREYEN